MKKDELISTLAAAKRDGYLLSDIDPEWVWLCVAATNRLRVIGGRTRKRRTRRNMARLMLNLFQPTY